jgi:multidrug transporter EmrE-like cation transporter
MNLPLLIVIVSQLLFTAGDLLARHHMRGNFAVANFLTVWFVAYLLLRTAATFGQLYVLSTVDLGKTMALFGAASVMIANVLGWLVLQEVLPPISYVGIALAVLALAVMGWR